MAAIITIHETVNQTNVPRSVPGLASVPAIRSTVHHHASPAVASSTATSSRCFRAS